MTKDNKFKPFNDRFDDKVMYSEEYKEGDGICSSYRDGKCAEEPGKYCDGCASEYRKITW